MKDLLVNVIRILNNTTFTERELQYEIFRK